MDKSLEQKILETKLLLRQVIGQADLNVSIIELIVKDLYNEIADLSKQHLDTILKQAQIQQKEDNDGNTNEEG